MCRLENGRAIFIICNCVFVIIFDLVEISVSYKVLILKERLSGLFFYATKKPLVWGFSESKSNKPNKPMNRLCYEDANIVKLVL